MCLAGAFTAPSRNTLLPIESLFVDSETQSLAGGNEDNLWPDNSPWMTIAYLG